jgi:hypothetical protein
VRKPYIVLFAVLFVVACAAPMAAADSADDPPVPQTLAPANITPAAAVLQGTVDDFGGHTVTFWFELGTTTDYGTTTERWTTNKAHTDITRGFGGLAQGTTYHVRLAASNEHGVAYGNDVTFTTDIVPASPNATPGNANGRSNDDSGDDAPGSLPPAAPPAIGRSVGVDAGGGTVLARLPGSSRAIALKDAASVPVGAILDTRRGSLDLTSELPDGTTQTGTFHGGVFQVRQPKGSAGMTELVLRGDKPTCGGTGGARAAATVAKRPPRGLWGKDNHGRFRTRASNSVATVRGTEWYVGDRCDGTITRVKRGAVSVRDLHSGRTVIVRAGQSYLAKAR